MNEKKNNILKILKDNFVLCKTDTGTGNDIGNDIGTDTYTDKNLWNWLTKQ